MYIINQAKETLIELFQFIKNPEDERSTDDSFKQKTIYLISFFLLNILVVLCLYLPLHALLYYINPEFTMEKSRINYNFETIRFMIFFGIIFTPLFEELIFRGFLRYSSIMCKRETWDKNFKYLVYISIIIFAFMHIFNYQRSSFIVYILSPLLLISHLSNGIVMTFLRVKYNLRTSILYHFMWNLIIGLLVPLIFIQFAVPYQVNNKDYSVKIEKLAFCDLDKQKKEIISENNKIYKLKFEDYSINDILDSVCNYNHNREDYLINIELESKDGIDKDALKKILLKYYKEKLE